MPSKYNVIFSVETGITHFLTVDYDITVEELLKKYINKYHEYYKPFKVKELFFTFNAKQIKKNEQKTVEDYFQPNANPNITEDFS